MKTLINLEIQLVIIFLFISTTISAQGTYSYVKEGRTWHGYRTGSVPYVIPYTHVIYGDTLISGKQYKKKWILDTYRGDIDMHYYGAYREEEGKLFCVEKGKTEEIMLIDLDMEPGDSWVIADVEYAKYTHTVVGKKTMTIGFNNWSGPIEGRVLAIRERAEFKYAASPHIVDDTRNFYYIEGVGMTTDLHYMYGWAEWAGTPFFLKDNYDGELCATSTEALKQIEQEMQEAVTQIEQAEATGKNPPAGIYDLEGRKLPAEPRAGQVYIKEGRKQVGR